MRPPCRRLVFEAKRDHRALVRMLISEVSVRCTGHLLAISSSRERCSRVKGPSNRELTGPFPARATGLRLALALEIERHRSADQILQSSLIDLVAFVNVDGAPDISVQAGVE